MDSVVSQCGSMWPSAPEPFTGANQNSYNPLSISTAIPTCIVEGKTYHGVVHILNVAAGLPHEV
eukprot:m.689910 g.689910  ORF g.689910 m.689910 type:complete len:64 (-) comp22847_c0_seq40:875-1066(-)